MTTKGTNMGHGHVWERPDGRKTRCGGPAICTHCALDAAKKLVAESDTLVLGVGGKPREHKLKTWPEPFQAVIAGAKRFEVRRDDRGFAVGDTLRLEEYVPSPPSDVSVLLGSPSTPTGAYTGRAAVFLVTYMIEGTRWGLEDGFVAMSLELSTPVPWSEASSLATAL